MAQFVVIHTATRVIRRVSSESAPVAKDETILPLAIRIDLAGSPTGYWKLDLADTLVPATAQEIDDANVDPARVGIKRVAARDAMLAALQSMSQDNALPPSLSAFAAAYLQLIS